jgi:hypothetical protein
MLLKRDRQSVQIFLTISSGDYIVFHVLLVMSPRNRMPPKLNALLHQCPGSLCFHNVRIGACIRLLLNRGSNDSSHIGPFLFFQIVVVALLVFLLFVFLLWQIISEPPFLCRIPWENVESVGVLFWKHGLKYLQCCRVFVLLLEGMQRYEPYCLRERAKTISRARPGKTDRGKRKSRNTNEYI